MRSQIMYCLRCGASLKGAKKLEDRYHSVNVNNTEGKWPRGGKRITFECPQCHAPQTRQELHLFN